MEYTEIIYLISTEIKEDDIGNQSSSDISYNKCYAKKQNVNIKEYYNAVAVGMKPTVEFAIKKDNYNNEVELKWNDAIYKVIRYIDDPNNKMDIILICSQKLGVS